ncbi:MAG: type III PLP-dependent enzyme [Verrucomicrobiota bacterium]
MSDFLTQLAKTYGTPFYAYDLGVSAKQAERLQSLFPQEANPRLLFSFKSNPLPSLAASLAEAGCEADLTSLGELASAQQSKFDLTRALFGGPGKSGDEVAEAIKAGVRQFSVESWQDLSVVAEQARKQGVLVSALLRVNPLEAPKAKLVMSGVASQFGFEEDQLLAAPKSKIEEVSDAVHVKGTHIYWGTQIADPNALLACFESAMDTAERVQRAMGIDLEVVNLGGGFAWPYAVGGEGGDLSPLAEGLEALRAQAGAAREADWWFESGRYLTAPAGTLVTRVMDLKESKKEKRYLILDTGIHHLGGMSGLGRIPRPILDLTPLEPRGGEDMKVDVVGPLCSPLDCVGRNMIIPELRPGDLLQVPNVGAYGVTASLTGFLSRPTPKEIAYANDQVVAVHQLNYGHTPVAA